MDNKKKVYTEDFPYETARVGDLVTDEVIYEAINCMPPAFERSDCTQMGMIFSYQQDPPSGKYWPTYATFKQVADGIWEYCGTCFRGENVERWRQPTTYQFKKTLDRQTERTTSRGSETIQIARIAVYQTMIHNIQFDVTVKIIQYKNPSTKDSWSIQVIVDGADTRDDDQESVPRYLPSIYTDYENECRMPNGIIVDRPKCFRIQTTSFGVLDMDEYEKYLNACQWTVEAVCAIEAAFLPYFADEKWNISFLDEETITV